MQLQDVEKSTGHHIIRSDHHTRKAKYHNSPEADRDLFPADPLLDFPYRSAHSYAGLLFVASIEHKEDALSKRC